jgi:uncharacterized membrane protein
MNKPARKLLGLSIMFFVIAVAVSLVIWGEVSWEAKIGLFAFGFASGVLAGQWIVKRNA